MLCAAIGAGNRWCGELEAFFNAVQPGGNDCSHGQIGVDICTGAACLQPGSFGAARNHAETGGTVVDAPGGFDRCPKAVDQALVAVDGRPDHGAEVHHAGDLACDVALEKLAHLAWAFGIKKQVVFTIGQALVNMAAAAWQLLVGLGHKAGHDAKARGNFFATGLEQNGAVGLLQCFTETNGDFINAGAGFGVQTLNRHAKGQHLVHDGGKEIAVLVHAQQ